MKVKVLGNGITWVKRPDTHFLIDDKILIDTPTGSVKQMFGQVDIGKIEYIFITHFHQDHFMDLNILFNMFLAFNKKVTVFAPKHARSKLLKILKLSDNEYGTKKAVDKTFNFVKVKPNTAFNFGNYKAQVFPASHNVKQAFSYIITSNVSVGFSGDTAYSENLKSLIEKCDIVFLDTSNLNEKSSNHLSATEVEQIKKLYPNKKIYSVHVNDEVYNKCKKTLQIPEVGEEFVF